ncbi:MAG: type I glyceraldehyde-3-phosphate dehydrogenase [Epsilonproteobacteria bacterium]|nr:type I glyceraldehyde-3-phosphate dehydrogenase [Campylobacterota bacterium]
MIKIAINGFGRIGRYVARLATQDEEIELVAINDLADIEMAAYLLKYDSVHGSFLDLHVKNETTLHINGRDVAYFQQPDPQKLNFGSVGADVVLECSGVFLTTDAVKHHIEKGVKKVIISAVAKDETPTFVLGVNEQEYKDQKIISNGSCTTNCLAPIAKIIDEEFGIQKGLMTTIHSYTNGQNLLDSKHPSDLRRSRAAAANMIPTTTNAAKGIYKVLPLLKGKLHGQSVRVPVPDVSIMDLNLVLERNIEQKELELLFDKASKNELNGIILVDNEKRVSSDFLGSPYSSIIASDLTQVIGGNLVKIMAWYDNESGYSNRLLDMTKYILQ